MVSVLHQEVHCGYLSRARELRPRGTGGGSCGVGIALGRLITGLVAVGATVIRNQAHGAPSETVGI